MFVLYVAHISLFWSICLVGQAVRRGYGWPGTPEGWHARPGFHFRSGVRLLEGVFGRLSVVALAIRLAADMPTSAAPLPWLYSVASD